jgi:lipid-A-disaccharide synthase
VSSPEPAGITTSGSRVKAGAANVATAGRPLRIALVAGEPSGDRLGAGLMRALREESSGGVTCVGVGGERMAEEGLTSLFPLDDLAVMGLVEVLPHAPRILRRLAETARFLRDHPPDALVTIDAPGFNFRLARCLRKRSFPLIHTVAPSVWAWRPGRAATVAKLVDHLLVLLPFEPPWFEAHGLPVTWVGHPDASAAAGVEDSMQQARARLGLPAEGPVVALLAGSRRGEAERLLPIFGQALDLVSTALPGLAVVAPTLAPVEPMVRRAVAAWRVPAQVTIGMEAKVAAFAAADAALAASGTVAVELAAAGCPAVIAYRVAPLTAIAARRLIRVPYVSLVNLAAGREVQPELLQERCTPETLAQSLLRLLSDSDERTKRAREGLAAVSKLAPPGLSPSRRAARAVLAQIAHPRPAHPAL